MAIDHSPAMPPKPPSSTSDEARLLALLTALGQDIECLCQNISGLRADMATTTQAITSLADAHGQAAEQAGLLRNRLERIHGALDGFERWAVDHLPGYPQDRHPNSVTMAVTPFNGRRP
jgi:hypothetical protein